MLTPLAVDPAHPFPYISGLSLNLAVTIRNPKTDKEYFARVKVPPIFDRFVPLGNQRFVPLEDVIGEHLKRLFPGMEVLEVHTFRVTRNEDLEVEEDDAENLLAALEKELLRRRFGPPVRLEVEESMTQGVLDLLVSELGVSVEEVFRLPGPLDLRGLHNIADQNRQELKYDAFVPSTHPLLAEVESSAPVDVFKATRRNDVLLHHPYDSFATSVQRFIEQAAADPHVLAIKQTLYRTSGDSPIIDALIDAAEAGKQVLVLVEIKARFDEEANIRWARSSSSRAATSSTAWSASRPTASWPWSCATNRTGSAATPTSAPATTTRRPPGCTRTSACSPPTSSSARTSRTCSTTCPAGPATRRTAS